MVDGKEVLAIEGMRMLGFWSARAIFLMEFLYVAVFIAGFASIRNTSNRLAATKKPAVSSGFWRADDGIRTHDLLHGKQTL